MTMVQHQEFDLRKAAVTAGNRPVDAVLLTRADEDNTDLLAGLNITNDVAVRSMTRAAWASSQERSNEESPDLLLVDAERGTPEDIDFIRRLKANDNSKLLPVIALVERGGGHAKLEATTAGADAVIEKPVAGCDLREILSQPHPGLPEGGGRSKAQPKVVVFMHMTGGAGATTLAVNLSCALSQATPHQETCLLDLDLQFGSCDSFLDLAHASPMAGFIEDPSRLDSTMLDSMMAQHPSGLRVLTSPDLPMPLEALTPAAVDTLLRITQQHYQNIVVDMPATLTRWTDTVLKAATVVYLVTATTVPAAQRLTKFLTLLRREKLTHLPIKIVVNRSGSSTKNRAEISLAEFSKVIGKAPDHLIPNDYALVSLSQNQGTPALRLKPKSEFSLAVHKMADQDVYGIQGTKPSRRLGLFK